MLRQIERNFDETELYIIMFGNTRKEEYLLKAQKGLATLKSLLTIENHCTAKQNERFAKRLALDTKELDALTQYGWLK